MFDCRPGGVSEVAEAQVFKWDSSAQDCGAGAQRGCGAGAPVTVDATVPLRVRGSQLAADVAVAAHTDSESDKNVRGSGLGWP